jgi:hypothetical protein
MHATARRSVIGNRVTAALARAARRRADPVSIATTTTPVRARDITVRVDDDAIAWDRGRCSPGS